MNLISTYEEAHWYTGKIKTRCSLCKKVVYVDGEEANFCVKQIQERDPRMSAYKGKRCGYWHVGHKRTLK